MVFFARRLSTRARATDRPGPAPWSLDLYKGGIKKERPGFVSLYVHYAAPSPDSTAKVAALELSLLHQDGGAHLTRRHEGKRVFGAKADLVKKLDPAGTAALAHVVLTQVEAGVRQGRRGRAAGGGRNGAERTGALVECAHWASPLARDPRRGHRGRPRGAVSTGVSSGRNRCRGGGCKRPVVPAGGGDRRWLDEAQAPVQHVDPHGP